MLFFIFVVVLVLYFIENHRANEWQQKAVELDLELFKQRLANIQSERKTESKGK